MINRDRLVKTFTDLVQIDSPSGEEEAMAEELTRRLEGFGLTVKRDAYGNVIANDGRPDPLLLSAHMDTVEPGRGVKPSVDGDRIVSDGTTIPGRGLQVWRFCHSGSIGVSVRGRFDAASGRRGRIHARGGDWACRCAQSRLLDACGKGSHCVRRRGFRRRRLHPQARHTSAST